MRWILIAAMLVLSGCASWTPEQWQAFGQAMNDSAQQYNYQQQLRLQEIRNRPRPIQCISNRVGTMTYTNCY